jgi:hypothetical protein
MRTSTVSLIAIFTIAMAANTALAGGFSFGGGKGGGVSFGGHKGGVSINFGGQKQNHANNDHQHNFNHH